MCSANTKIVAGRTESGIVCLAWSKFGHYLPTCRYDVCSAGLLLLPETVGGPAEDGPVVQLVEGGVDQLGHAPPLGVASLLKQIFILWPSKDFA